MKELLLAAVGLVTVFTGFTSNANAWVVVVYRPPQVRWHYVYWYP